MKTRTTAALLFLMLLFTLPACSAAGTTAAPTLPPTLPPTQTVAVPTQIPSPVLTIMAADSLTASFTELGKVFEASHPGTQVAFNFASAPQLAQQLRDGSPADVFASDATIDMDSAVQAGQVAKGAPKIFVENKLVVIFPPANPKGIAQLVDLAKPGLVLAAADASVPLGGYTATFLSLASLDPGFTPTFQADVEKNVLSYENDGAALTALVAASQADAGICYVTDFTRAAAGTLSKLDIPDALNVVAVYQIAPVSSSSNPVMAQAFVDLALSPQGQQIMGKYGFILTNP
jgi:molybdate transport system substrate-binding protein